MTSLQGHLLIAAPALSDPNFTRSVVLLVEHNAEGALGLVLNRPSQTTLEQAWHQINQTRCAHEGFVHVGGPCQGPLMVVHTQQAQGQVVVVAEAKAAPGVYFSTEQESVQWLVEHPSSPIKFFVGYAGWGPGQLEQEIEVGGWITAPADAHSIFDAGDDQWPAVVRVLSLGPLLRGLNPRIVPDDPSVN